MREDNTIVWEKGKNIMGVVEKKISVVIPCYNEEKTIKEIYERLLHIFNFELKEYDYEIIYVDDYSTDNTREEIRKVCSRNQKVKGIFNARNFGFHRNVFQSYQYASGDAVFMMFGDLQDPPEMLPIFVKKWLEGHQCVVGQRKKSTESKVKYFLRKVYYKIMNMLSDTSQIEMINGFGLYDRSFVDVLKKIDDTTPFFKAVLNEYGMNICIVPYDQSAGKRGRSNFNILKNYDFVMQGLTSSTKLLMRFATFTSIIIAIICIIYTTSVFIRKILNPNTFLPGTASVMVGVFFLGAIQLFFIGILGEYILSINEKTSRKPRVIVGEKINFEEEN